MKILFIQKDPIANLGVMGISAYLTQNGHETELMVLNAEKDYPAGIRGIKPDIIAFSCTTGLHAWALGIARSIKRSFDVPILLGGPHPTFYPDILDHPAVDIICIGEGEKPVRELLDAMRDNRDITGIENLHVKRGGAIIKNPVRDLVADLDDLPPPDRSVYRRYPFIMRQENLRVITSRGCPYDCTFCFNRSMKELYRGKGNYVRQRSAAHVIGELVAAKNGLGIKRIDFVDDSFTLSAGWLRSFLPRYKEKVDLPFTCGTRADLLTEEIVRLLKDAGCRTVKMGLESSNGHLNADVLKKRVNMWKMREAASLVKKAGMKIQTFNMLCIPGETVDNAIETLKFNIAMKADFARCSLLNPYPKTEIEKYAKDKGYLDRDFSLKEFEASYFTDTPLRVPDKSEFINLQRLFNVFNRFPFLLRFARHIIKLPNNILFDIIFKVDFGLAMRSMDGYSLRDSINAVIYSKGYFANGDVPPETGEPGRGLP